MFREALEETRGEVISYEDALLLWLDTVYSPAVDEIKNSGAMERCNYSPPSASRSNAPALERPQVCIPTPERGNEVGRLNDYSMSA
jgi:hypothetical protein